MYRKSVIMLAAVLILSAATFIIAGIARTDVIAANDFPRQTAASPLTAGDIVVIAGDGPRRLCSGQILDSDLTKDDRTGRYFNRAARTLVGYVSVIMGEEKAAALLSGHEIHFHGSASALAKLEPAYKSLEPCKCDIARALSRQQRVCMVETALVETALVQVSDGMPAIIKQVNRSLAVSLVAEPVTLPDAVFAQCGYGNEEGRKNSSAVLGSQLSCADKSGSEQGMPFVVGFRKRLGLIDFEPSAMLAQDL